MYQALYRKYRPSEFDDVVGQNVIVNALKNAVIYNHISHAYLFSGPRGTGKTTIAKIFARAVNCLDSNDGLSCGKCKNCLYSFSKECMDIIEIDAASNNGVDEIRELRNKVSILPTELKYKVYIIDEVHMLSIGAFNALLKTIEEPPSHVIFILATTDPQKIPATIISRCQWYAFKKIDNTDIVRRLQYIVEKENIKIDGKVLEKIADASDGGLRDAIGLLDKLRAYSTGNISLDDFYEINGQINDVELQELEKMIFSNNVKETLFKLESYYQDGKNLVQILKQLMILIKDQLFDYYINSADLITDEYTLVDFLNLLNNEMINIKKSDDVKLSIEITLLHYMDINSKKNVKEETIENKTYVSEKTDEVVSKQQKIIDEKVINSNDNFDFAKLKELMLIRSKNTMINALKSELTKEQRNLDAFNDYTFDQENGYLACELLDGTVRASCVDSVILSYEYESMIKKMANHLDKLNKFYNRILNNKKKIALITNDEWDNLKSEYMLLRKSGKQFTYQEEPSLNINNINDKISSEKSETSDFIEEAKELFGDIVEIEED